MLLDDDNSKVVIFLPVFFSVQVFADVVRLRGSAAGGEGCHGRDGSLVRAAGGAEAGGLGGIVTTSAASAALPGFDDWPVGHVQVVGGGS